MSFSKPIACLALVGVFGLFGVGKIDAIRHMGTIQPTMEGPRQELFNLFEAKYGEDAKVREGCQRTREFYDDDKLDTMSTGDAWRRVFNNCRFYGYL